MNNNPVMIKGAITINDPGFPENALKKTDPATAAIIKSIPPITSHFQLITSTAVSIRTGIL